MRKLKFHEQKLLRKVNFFEYKKEKNLREVKILRKYHVQKREDYTKCAHPSMIDSAVPNLPKVQQNRGFRQEDRH